MINEGKKNHVLGILLFIFFWWCGVDRFYYKTKIWWGILMIFLNVVLLGIGFILTPITFLIALIFLLFDVYERDFSKFPVKQLKYITDTVESNILELRGLLLNNAKLYLRRYKTNLITLLLPLLCILYVELMQVVMDYVIDELHLEEKIIQHKQQQFMPADLPTVQYVAGGYFNFSFPNQVFYSSTDNYTISQMHNIYVQNITYKDSHGVEHDRTTPVLQRFNHSTDINRHLWDLLDQVEGNRSTDVLGALNIKHWDHESIEYILQYDFDIDAGDNDNRNKILKMVVNDVSAFCERIQLFMNTRDCNPLIVTGLMDDINNVFLQKEVSTQVNTKVQHMKYTQVDFQLHMNLKEYLDQYFFPLILNLLIPVFLFKIVSEKRNKLKEMMKLMGLRYENYVISNVIFILVIYLISVAFFILLAWIFSYRVITQTHWGILLIIIFGCGLQVIAITHLLASFINDATLATIFGYFFVLIIPIVGYVLDGYVLHDGNYWIKIVLLFPAMPVCDVIFRISQYCPDMHSISQFSQLWTYSDLLIGVIILYATSFFYFFVGLYLEEVLPKEWGRRKGLCFCFESCFSWFFKLFNKKTHNLIASRDPNEDEDVKKLRDMISRGEINKDNSSILIKKIFKVFKKNYAVNGVSFNLQPNEIFGLLGPNGAGKTTLIRMLVGLYSQTSGEAYINGNSISTSMRKIRRSLGYCPQFNILWDDLTAEEHVLFYCRLKGVTICDEYKHTRDVLRSVGLHRPKTDNFFCRMFQFFVNFDKKVSEMSDGEKRRLAIGCALAGNPKVVIMDEPTTGLGPGERSQVWKIVLNEKKNRSVLITTHSMEEADVLSDKIGIFSKGNLICCGPSLVLKARYGTGYTLGITSSDVGRTKEYVTKSFEYKYKVELIKEFGSSIEYSISPIDKGKMAMKLSEIYTKIETNKEIAGIEDFQLNQGTLEDVFLNVIKKAELLEIEEEKKKSRIKSKKKTEKSEIVININEEEEESEKKSSKTTSESDLLIPKSNVPKKSNRQKCCWCCWVCCCRCICVNTCQTWYLLKKNFILAWRGLILTLVILLSPLFITFVMFMCSLIVVKMDYIINPIEQDITFAKCTPWNGTCFTYGYSVGDNVLGAQVMDEIIKDYNLIINKDVKKYDTCDDLEEWIGSNPNRTQIGICFTDWMSNDPSNYDDVYYTIYYNATASDFNVGDSISPSQVAVTKTIIDNTIYYIKKTQLGYKNVTKDNIKVTYKTFPSLPSKKNGQGVIYSSIGPQLFVLAELLLFMIVIQKVVFEKERKLKYAMEVIGLRKVAYFASWMIYFSIYSAVMAIVALIGGLIFQFYPFLYGNQLILFFLFFLFGIALTSLGLLISSFISKTRVAIVLGFVIFAIFAICDEFLANGLYISIFMDVNSPSWVYTLFELFYPNWNFAKILTDIIAKTSLTYDPISKVWLYPPGFGWSDLFVGNVYEVGYGLQFNTQPTYVSFLFLFANIFLFLFLYLICETFFSAYGRGYTLCFCLHKLFGRKRVQNVNDINEASLIREYEKIRENPDNYTIILKDLSKTYFQFGGKRTNATKALNFGVEKNSLMTLIGINGSGKTTTLDCLSGMHFPTSGDAQILGLSINSKLHQVQQNIGVCHQNDHLWDEMTAKEHLNLFCEIRGLRYSSINDEITTRLKEVSLYNVRNDKVKTFSGGMKRRLSVCMSCIANPNVILLDEPSTGMDPYSKREVWKIIFDLKTNKSILITTHSMDEAEALSDRIAILSKGEIKCIGTSLSLKNKYGSCYLLKMIIKNEKERELHELVYKHFEKDANKLLINEGSGIYKLKIYPNQFNVLSKFLKIMEDEIEREGGCIDTFGLSHSSLEEVLVKVSESDKSVFEERKDLPKDKAINY